MDSWRVATHTMPDLDALSASAAVFWIVGQQDEMPLSFWDGAGAPPFAHNPSEKDVIVDIGGADAFDHHHLPDPRSSCAFTIVIDHFAASHRAVWRERAQLLAPLKPAFLRQDSTGALFDCAEDNRTSIASALRALAWQEVDDAAIWQWFSPVLMTIFDAVARDPQSAAFCLSWRNIERIVRSQGKSEIADKIDAALRSQLREHDCARRNPELFLRVVTEMHIMRDPPIVAYAYDAVVGEWSPVLYDREALAALFPDAAVLISQKRWKDREGGDRTWSLNIGRALTSVARSVDIRRIYHQLRADTSLPAAIREEMSTWHVESWFCGRGSLKRPMLRLPPHMFLLETVRALTRLDQALFAAPTEDQERFSGRRR